MRAKIAMGLAALVVSALAQTPAGAASGPPVGSPELRDSRVPASVPNISGVWTLQRAGLRIAPAAGGDPPWLPWAQAVFRDRALKESQGTPMWDPTGACWGSGIPRILTIGYPQEIIQTADQIVWMNESQHVFRIVRMNAKHLVNPQPSFMGDPVGHWEGDTLVIDTTGYSDKAQIDERGTPMTDKLHVVERITRKDDILSDLFTIDDPGAYSKPWTALRTFKFGPGEKLTEHVCEENNRNTPGADGKFVTRLK